MIARTAPPLVGGVRIRGRDCLVYALLKTVAPLANSPSRSPKRQDHLESHGGVPARRLVARALLLALGHLVEDGVKKIEKLIFAARQAATHKRCGDRRRKDKRGLVPRDARTQGRPPNHQPAASEAVDHTREPVDDRSAQVLRHSVDKLARTPARPPLTQWSPGRFCHCPRRLQGTPHVRGAPRLR